MLIVSTILGSWLGMQAVHESGHVFGAMVTHGTVDRVVLHPLTISRTDLSENPSPLLVVWAGPVFGVVAPVVAWAITAIARMTGAFVLRFFAGFCLIANGVYIGAGSFDGVGDCGQMLRHGSDAWHLWAFGAVTAPLGLLLWHGQGSHFGLGPKKGQVDRRIAYVTLVASLLLLAIGFVVGA